MRAEIPTQAERAAALILLNRQFESEGYRLFSTAALASEHFGEKNSLGVYIREWGWHRRTVRREPEKAAAVARCTLCDPR